LISGLSVARAAQVRLRARAYKGINLLPLALAPGGLFASSPLGRVSAELSTQSSRRRVAIRARQDFERFQRCR
jgi:hypothetical protein